MAGQKKSAPEIKVPSPENWLTSDADEINKRRLRARQESFVISNRDPRHPIFSNFNVQSASGFAYSVEVRDICGRQFGCDCIDFRINGLGTCKHVEAVLLFLDARFRKHFRAAAEGASPRFDVVVEPAEGTLRLLNYERKPPQALRRWFNERGSLVDISPEEAIDALAKLSASALPELRISQEVGPWLENRRRAEERREMRRQYELNVQSGQWPAHETKAPLFPYQREGMLHLAFTERALLGDEMGLGKTIQAIAACALLHRLGRARRVLVVTPASLKTEWEEQIRRFTDLPYQIVFGGRPSRVRAYAQPPFFTIVNYEQMVADALDVNEHLRPDVVVLDEAQRIKNWNTKTAQAIKRLRSRYAFVLTGTPIENRIDELHSLMDFLDPSALGPLFRFNRDFYEFNERGRPVGYRNLDLLHARIKPFMLRRRKAEVETELPPRTDRNYFVRMSPAQEDAYAFHEKQVSRLVQIANRRPLTRQEQEKLQRELAMMRMICDSNYILDQEDRVCPKLAELDKILDECRANDAKVIVFSEWERMLVLVRELCEQRGDGYAWHTGSVPQKRRRAEINVFKSDPNCRVFLSTDSGATGLNLQTASVVINCDLPWNPARLEQRIARAWRKHQTRPVTVVNLISEETIEHRMLDTLAIKQTLAETVLDRPGVIKEIKIRSGRQAFLERLQQLVTRAGRDAAPRGPSNPAEASARSLPPDPAEAFAQLARERINGALVRCEERYPQTGPHSVLVVVVDGNAAQYRQTLSAIHSDVFTGKTDPLAPTQIEVIDRATAEAIERLTACGLIATATRATRALFPVEQTSAPPALSDAQRAKIASLRSTAEHKLKVARVLLAGGLDDEARPHLAESLHKIASALAVQHCLPDPASVEDAFLPPLCHLWKDSLPVLRNHTATPAPALHRLTDLLAQF